MLINSKNTCSKAQNLTGVSALILYDSNFHHKQNLLCRLPIIIILINSTLKKDLIKFMNYASTVLQSIISMHKSEHITPKAYNSPLNLRSKHHIQAVCISR